MAYIELRAVDTTTMEVCLGELDTSYDKDNRLLYWSYKKSYETNWSTSAAPMELLGGKKRSARFVMSGLSPGVTYNINCLCVFTNSTETSKEFYENYTTVWQWKNLRTGEAVCNTSYKEWNAFVDAVKSKIYINGENATPIGSNPYAKPASTTYDELLELARITPDDKTLYAEKFNYLRYCVGSAVKPTGIADKQRGAVVAANDFYIITALIT